MLRFGIAIGLVCALLISSCTKAVLDPKQYKAWVENADNGLKVVKPVGELVYTLQYCPVDYLILREQDTLPNEKQIAERRKALLGAEYYHLRIGTKNKSDVMQYGLPTSQDLIRRSDQLNFEFQQAIFLLAGNDTLPCAIYQFENSYGLSPDIVVNLGFQTNPNTIGQKRELYINDNVFGTGPLYLSLDKNALQATPQLRLH